MAKTCDICEALGWEDYTCAYCSMSLSPRHEHDHMPVPQRHGGDEVIPICVNCHDLKDRLPVRDWNVTALFEAWSGGTPTTKLLIAKLVGYVLDADRDLKEAGLR